MKEEIENLFDEANYCTTNDDCKGLTLGYDLIAFGCWRFVNKNYDTKPIFEKIREYWNCEPKIDKCALAPHGVCRGGKCVATEQ